ncbi:MAG: lysophospholipid acyltransferase family protein [Phycisphaerales bacterium]|nr:lysophospholipid acyltransferase family protein [Phycisphaerales bacterium]
MFRVFFLDKKDRDAWLKKVCQYWIKLFLLLTGCRFVIRGQEYLQEDKAYIFTINHNSFMDIVVSYPFLPCRANKFLSKDSLEKLPLLGFIIGLATISINRKDKISKATSILKLKRCLMDGVSVAIFPEGTRNRSGLGMLPFQNGAFLLAKETEMTIVPVVLVNTQHILPVEPPCFFQPGTIELHILEPVAVTPHTNLSELRTQVFNSMKQCYDDHTLTFVNNHNL